MILWKNGVFHTMENKTKTHYQMATNKGVIVGFDDEIKSYDFIKAIDLEGSHIYPGFVDSHMHILGYGRKITTPNINQVKDKTKVLKLINNFFQNELLYVQGYFECGITKDDLNKISNKLPILLRHNDYHSATVNDVILKKTNIKSETGVLTEHDAQKAVDTFSKFSNKELEEMLTAAINSLYSYGITGAHSDDLFYFNGFNDTIAVFIKTLNKMPFRAHLLLHHLTLDDYNLETVDLLKSNKFLELGSVGEIFYDGTISSKTALMIDAYANSNNYGLKVHSDKEFVNIIKKARAKKLTVSVHTMGDKAILDVIKILRKYPPLKNQHDRLIHTPFLNDEVIKELKSIPLSLDIQPQFLASDLPWALDYFSKVPSYVFPWKTLKNTKINIAGGSDAPVEKPNPLLGIYDAIERKSNHDNKAYFIDEALTRYEAISLYTSGANYSALEKNKGFLKKGYIADFSVFKKDLLTMEIELFKDKIVYMTIVNEEIVFKSKE